MAEIAVAESPVCTAILVMTSSSTYWPARIIRHFGYVLQHAFRQGLAIPYGFRGLVLASCKCPVSVPGPDQALWIWNRQPHGRCQYALMGDCGGGTGRFARGNGGSCSNTPVWRDRRRGRATVCPIVGGRGGDGGRLGTHQVMGKYITAIVGQNGSQVTCVSFGSYTAHCPSPQTTKKPSSRSEPTFNPKFFRSTGRSSGWVQGTAAESSTSIRTTVLSAPSSRLLTPSPRGG